MEKQRAISDGRLGLNFESFICYTLSAFVSISSLQFSTRSSVHDHEKRNRNNLDIPIFKTSS